MVESGGGWWRPTTLANAEADGQALAVKLGAPADATVDQLRALPVDALVAAGGRYGPIVDGRLMTEGATEAFARGDNIHVPLIIGSNSYEASLMASFGIPAAAVVANVPPRPGRSTLRRRPTTTRWPALSSPTWRWARRPAGSPRNRPPPPRPGSTISPMYA